MSKIIDLFTEVDPFIEYTPKERSRDLVVLHFKVSILSIIGFLIYSAVNVILFIIAPYPSELTIETIYSNETNDPIFQFDISLFQNQFNCQSGPQYTFPYQNKLTKNAQKFTTQIISQGFSGQNFDTYKFPIYGTVDANSLTSFAVVFNLCYPQISQLSGSPILLSISNNPLPNYDKLNVKFTQPGDFSDIQILANDQDFSSYLMYFSSSNKAFQNIEISLQKTIYPSGQIKYNAFFNGGVKYIASPFGAATSSNQQIMASLNPSVSVITYKPKNPLTLIGSITGIFPLFMLIGNKLSAKIDGCKKRGKEDEIAMEERGVLNTNA